MRELAVIACCKTKKRSGDTSLRWQAEGSIVSRLPASGKSALLEAREDIGKFRIVRADVEIRVHDDLPRHLMPAIRRYQGAVYTKGKSHIADGLGRASGLDIVIVSARYGLLASWEPIPWYELEMNDVTTEGQRIKSWWRQRGLGALLVEYFENLQPRPSRVHNLLPTAYAHACIGFERIAKPLVFPGRSSSNHARYDYLQKLLMQAASCSSPA